MELKLTVYEDETLANIKRVAEADTLKIPYRVAMDIAASLELVDLDNNNQILNVITSHMDKLDKIMKATFKVTEAELECVNIMELGAVGTELYKWGISKINSLKGDSSKNA